MSDTGFSFEKNMMSVHGTFSNYEITRSINSGGQGQVYEARGDSGARVVVKVYETGRPSDFQREIDTLNSLRGSVRVVTLLDFGYTESAKPFIVLEPLWKNLQWCVGMYKRFSYRSALLVVFELIVCLQAIHVRGIVSNDVKLSNFCFVQDFQEKALQVKIIDFGLAQKYNSEAFKPINWNAKRLSKNGTLKYSSRACMLGMAPCPYDDVESLLYAVPRLFGCKVEWTSKNRLQDIFKAKKIFWSGAPPFVPHLMKIYDFFRRNMKREGRVDYDGLYEQIGQQYYDEVEHPSEGIELEMVTENQNLLTVINCTGSGYQEIPLACCPFPEDYSPRYPPSPF